MAAPAISSLNAPSEFPSFKDTCIVDGKKLRYTLIPSKNQDYYHAYVKQAGKLFDFDKKVDIRWQGIQPKDIRNIAPSQLNIKIEPAGTNFELIVTARRPMERPVGLLPPIRNTVTSSGSTSQLNINFIFLETASDLVSALEREESPLLKQIVDEMVDYFCSKSTGFKLINLEMITLLPVMDEDQRYELVNRFINAINRGFLQQKRALEALREILHSFQRLNDAQIAKQAIVDENSKEILVKPPTFTLSPQQLAEVAKLLLNKSTSGSSASSNLIVRSPDNLRDLEAAIAVLEVMRTYEVVDLERKKYHEDFYDILDKFDLSANLKQAFLAAYGKQIVVHIPDNETTSHSFFRHSFSLVKACIDIYKAWSEKSLIPLKDAVRHLRDAASFQQFKADWYATLFSINFALSTMGTQFLESLKYLIDAFESDNSKAKEALENLHCHNPFLVMGFSRCLKQFLDYGTADLETSKTAILILEKICLDNLVGRTGPFTVHMGAYRTVRRFLKHDVEDVLEDGKVKERNESYAEQLHQETFEIIKSYACQHSNAAIRMWAEASAHSIHREGKYSDKLDIPSFKPGDVQNTIFEKTVNKIFPWRSGLRLESTKLAKDPQLEQEGAYYVNVKVATPDGNLDMDKAMINFLGSDKTAMLIAGTRGSGKTFSLKLFAKKLWQGGGPFFPIYIYLASLNDPKSAVKEALEKRGIGQDLRLLLQQSKIKIVFLLDAVDETKLGTSINLYDLNEFELWEESKVIFTCRSDVLKHKQVESAFHPNGSAEKFTRVDTLPFDRSQTEDFFNKFLDYLKSKNITPEWTAKEYLDFIKNNKLKEIISVPLFLYLTAETLPRIVALNSVKGKPNAEVTQNNLLDAFFCLMIEREIRKGYQGQGAPADIETQLKEYLNYALKVEQAIFTYETSKDSKGSPWIPEGYAKQKYPDLFDISNPAVESLVRCCFLCEKDGNWGFKHAEFYSYFHTLNGNRGAKDILKKRLLERQYGFDQMISQRRIIF